MQKKNLLGVKAQILNISVSKKIIINKIFLATKECGTSFNYVWQIWVLNDLGL